MNRSDPSAGGTTAMRRLPLDQLGARGDRFDGPSQGQVNARLAAYDQVRGDGGGAERGNRQMQLSPEQQYRPRMGDP